MLAGASVGVLVLASVLLDSTTGTTETKTETRYQPTWRSLDTRPLPQWYDDAKFGIFVHWGVFSVPSFGDEWFWRYWRGDKRPAYVDFMRRNYRPNTTYADLAAGFTAELFRPDDWARLFEAAGARYVVLTTKHHEGFTLWPSSYSWNWNAADVGPGRDLVRELAEAVRRTQHVRFGVYHSLFEWFNPLWLSDKAANFTRRTFPTHKTIPELYELVQRYHPDVIWSDGSIMARGGSDYWGSRQFIAWLYNDSPVRRSVVVNDRWGADAGCRHGDFFTCRDRYQPGRLLPHKWENCLSVDAGSWGYRRDATLSDILSAHQVLAQLVETVSCGGNLLLNVGPTHDGRITPIFEERLRQVGGWLAVNGRAIYGSRPWRQQNDSLTPGVWYTSNNDRVYASVLHWPAIENTLTDNDQDIEELKLGSVRLTPDTGGVTMLGYDRPLVWSQAATDGSPLRVRFPSRSQVTTDWVWVLEMKHARPINGGTQAASPPLTAPFTKFAESPHHGIGDNSENDVAIK